MEPRAWGGLGLVYVLLDPIEVIVKAVLVGNALEFGELFLNIRQRHVRAHDVHDGAQKEARLLGIQWLVLVPNKPSICQHVGCMVKAHRYSFELAILSSWPTYLTIIIRARR